MMWGRGGDKNQGGEQDEGRKTKSASHTIPQLLPGLVILCCLKSLICRDGWTRSAPPRVGAWWSPVFRINSFQKCIYGAREFGFKSCPLQDSAKVCPGEMLLLSPPAPVLGRMRKGEAGADGQIMTSIPYPQQHLGVGEVVGNGAALEVKGGTVEFEPLSVYFHFYILLKNPVKSHPLPRSFIRCLNPTCLMTFENKFGFFF